MEAIKIDTFLKYRFVSDPKFSLDGKHLAFVVKQAQPEKNGYSSDIFVCDAAYGDDKKPTLSMKASIRSLTTDRNVGAYTWKDGENILFTAPGQEDKTDIYAIRLSGGEAEKIGTVPFGADSLTMLADGRLLLGGTVPEENKDGAFHVMEEVPFWSNGAGFTNRVRRHLYIFDPAENSLNDISDPWEDCKSFDVMGNKILFHSYEWKDVCGVRDRITLYDAADKEKKVLLPQDLLYIENSRFISSREAIVSATGGEKYKEDQFPDFYKLNLEDGSLKLLCPYGASIGSCSVGTDARLGGGNTMTVRGNKLYFNTTIEESAVLCSVDIEGHIDNVFNREGACVSFDIYEENIAVCGFYGDRPAEIYINGEMLTDFNDMSLYTLSKREYHEFAASDGAMIHGYVMKPVDYVPGEKYPVILNIHGGPRTVFGSIFHHEMQMWANAGYFVIFCNPHGSDGRGDEFGYINGHYGTIDYEDIMTFTDKMLEAYPDMDKEHMGVTGGSYGGFMTNWIIGHTHRFKAAASLRSIANWISMEYMSDIGPVFVPLSMEGSTAGDVHKLWDQSPLKYVKNCKTPTLFVHSDWDVRCPLTEGLQMFSALKLLGCDTRMCVIKGENHELSRSGKPGNRIKRMEEILNWMDHYLKGGEENAKSCI